MASVINDPDGRKRIAFFDANGIRQSLRIGKADKKAAGNVAGHIEQIVSSKITRSAEPVETATWIASLDDVLHNKLSDLGLVAARESCNLGAWLDKYIASKSGLKRRSIRKLEQTKAKLLKFFGSVDPVAGDHAGQGIGLARQHCQDRAE